MEREKDYGLRETWTVSKRNREEERQVKKGKKMDVRDVKTQRENNWWEKEQKRKDRRRERKGGQRMDGKEKKGKADK